jgi:zinc transporter 2
MCDLLLCTGGYFSGSLAIMTDAAHMLSDFASYAISLSSMWLAERKPTKKMSFGFHRAGNKSVVIKMCLTRIIFS